MPTYCSFFVFEPDEIDMVLSLCAGTGWKASEIEDPSQKYKFSENGVITTTATVEALDEFGSLRNDEAYGRLLLLDGNENDINNIIQLISDSYTILKAYSDQKAPPSFGFPLDDNQADRLRTFNLIFKTKWYFDNFFIGRSFR